VGSVASLNAESVSEHLDDTVRAWLGLPRTAEAEVPQLPDELARSLLRVEELEQGHRDRYGCFEYSFSERYRAGRLWEPELDRWAAQERGKLAGGVELEPLWPDGKPFVVSVTHDVDMVSTASTPAQALRGIRRKLTTVESRQGRERIVRLLLADGQAHYWRLARTPPTAGSLERCFELELERGIRGTYFFSVYPAGRSSAYDCLYRLDDPCLFRGRQRTISELVTILAAEGAEIGLHGSFASALDGDRLAEERTALERATGLAVTTTRQHFLRWDVRATPRAQERAGLAVDSSVGFNRNVGFRAGTSLPFRLFDLEQDRPLDVLELPLLLQDGPLLAPDGLALDVPLARRLTAQLLDTVAEVGGVATVLYHPNSLADPDFLELYRFTLDYALESDAWVAPLGEVAAWWREREQRLAIEHTFA
jgi:peptidoglycan/xylan/chitin deacetylase (PgdA/CDA1 family)